jgi:type IV pilus assembly protein PilY1
MEMPSQAVKSGFNQFCVLDERFIMKNKNSILLTVASALLQVPIQATAGVVPPNVMFTLDDSGSMGFECLPDDLCIGDKRVGTMPDSFGSWKNGVATYDKVITTTEQGACIRFQGHCREYGPDVVTTTPIPQIFGRKMRSAAVNPLYYNPAVRYSAWLKADGTRYPEYAGTAARDFPETSGSTDVRNLAASQAINTAWCTGPSNCTNENQDVYFAQYFNLTGTDVNAVGSYTQVKIQSGSTYPKAAARTDCSVSTGVCTFAEELKNFSNWYSYHRSRIRVAIAGTAEAFYSVPGTYRVGYGRINKAAKDSIDGSPNLSTIEKGVRPFVDVTGGNKGSFYTWLFQQVPRSGGTPLRRALDDVGQYYSYTDNRGPWGEEPGTNNTVTQLACRRSFHMLMTDGMWNSDTATTSAAQTDVDNAAGTSITGPNSQSYTYSPAKPYRDSYANTLADVAMYYWNRDLHPGLVNGVKASANNPAFWQHMVNYTISFGVLGTLNPATDLPALTSGSKSWPQPGADQNENIDDLWHAAVNSRGKYVSASNTTEYSNALKSIIDDIAAVNGSEAGVAVSAKTLSTASTTRKYEAEFSSARWSGDIKAVNLTSTGADSTEAWTAVANLPAHGSRNIVTYNKVATGTKGLAFTWGSLSDTMKTTLFGATSGGDDLVNYLRGDRTNESGAYRPRASALGDIVNSAPILVKDQMNGQYSFLPSGVVGQTSYRRFLAAKKLRQAQLFAGANDGMLHAFSDANGAETFAFVPDSVLGKVKKLSAVDYEHEYFVDGPLAEADVYDASATKWRNLVLGGTGAGAKSLFAINVPVVSYPSDATTAPAALSAAQSAPGAADILWNISNTDTDFAELGYVLQAPEHGIMRDGTWVVIVGNGYDSTSKKAQLFVINALTGALVKKLDTGVGATGSVNGLGGVRLVRNANKQIVAAYAGDLLGNLWKFDFSSVTPTNWGVAFGGNPLYTTATVEPITAAPTYTIHPKGGVMVLFGSGKLHETGDEGVTAQRALYGIWDKVALGLESTTATDRVTVQTSIVAQALTSTALTGTTGTYYGLAVVPVDYQSMRGWRLPLTIGSGQRLVDDPEMAGGLVFMQTVTPSVALASCTASSLARYGFLLDPFMKEIEQPTFDTDGDNAFSSTDKKTASAVLLVGSGPATMVREFGKNKFRMAQARTDKNPLSQAGANTAKRYWRQVITQPD